MPPSSLTFAQRALGEAVVAGLEVAAELEPSAGLARAG